jgi:hypothetical protein
MNLQDDEMRREFDELLEPLRQMPQLSPQGLSAGRKAFLAKAEALSAEISPPVPGVLMGGFQEFLTHLEERSVFECSAY